jgi:hypothetical protein
VAVPAELGQPADDDAGDEEAHEIAARRTDEHPQPALALGEERQSDKAQGDVQRDRRESPARPERPGRVIMIFEVSSSPTSIFIKPKYWLGKYLKGKTTSATR